MDSEVAMQTEARAVPRSLALGTRIARELAPHEVFLLSMAALFSLIALVAAARVTEWPQVLLRMAIASSLILIVNFWSSSPAIKRSINPWPRRVRLLYLFPLIPIFFKTAEYISYPIHGRNFDNLFIAADRLMFGLNPTYWLYQHIPAWPALTEYLMICYSLFYFLPLAVAVELYSRARKEESLPFHTFDWAETNSTGRLEPVKQAVFIIVYGFLLSYLSYLLLPSIGPRFTLHNFFDLPKELPGLWLTEPLRQLLDRGENIIPGMTLAEILHKVTRDAFPSGHADITLLTILVAFRFKAKVRWYVTIIGLSLIFSTVYLRYHYVIDLVGGALLAIFTLYTWPWVYQKMVEIKARFS